MRKLIHSILGGTAALALVIGGAACSRSRDASTSSSVQTPSPAAERVNPGAGYYGSAPENVNRPNTAPTGIGGGPAGTAGPEDPWAPSGGSKMGIDQSGTGAGTSGTGSTGTGTDMTGGDMNSGDMGGGDAGPKGSGTTGGTSK